MSANPNTSLAQRRATELLLYPPEVLAKLRYRWDLWARPSQIPPPSEWSIYLDMGGVGSGKTRSAAEWLRSKIEPAERAGSPIRVGLVGRTAKDCRDVMVLGESGLLSVYPGSSPDWYRSSHAKVVFPHGSEAIMLSAEKPNVIRGFQFHHAWADEVATYEDEGLAVENLLLRLRLGIHPQLFLTTNPRPPHQIPWLAKLVRDPHSRNAVIRTSTTFDNAANLPKSYLDNARSLATTAYGRQEVLGEMVDLAGGLFQRDWIQYIPTIPSGRTFVAIDPAVTTEGDETGIVVVRRAGDKAYVLDDLSGHYTPQTWARLAVEAVQKYGAQAIVAEVSRGHDTIAAVIRQFDKQTPIREVHASKAKDLRAAPVAALYEQKRVFHARVFERLEAQMVSFDPTTQSAQRARKKATSPDRLDALVWGLTELGFHLGVAPKFSPREVPFPTSFE